MTSSAIQPVIYCLEGGRHNDKENQSGDQGLLIKPPRSGVDVIKVTPRKHAGIQGYH